MSEVSPASTLTSEPEVSSRGHKVGFRQVPRLAEAVHIRLDIGRRLRIGDCLRVPATCDRLRLRGLATATGPAHAVWATSAIGDRILGSGEGR